MGMAMVDTNDRNAMDDEHDEQTFAPVQPRLEKGRLTLRGGKHGRLISLEGLRQHAKNRYEGVLIAAARARQLNAKKVAMEERGMEEAAELKRLKMTSFALSELIEGKIKVERPSESIE